MIRHWPSKDASARGKETVTVLSLRVLYSCAEMCQVSREEPEGDMQARAACRCSLPGFDPERWNRDACPGAADEAERLLSSLIYGAEQQGIALDHDLDQDGCPWGWALSRFATSVARYSERRSPRSPLRNRSPALEYRLLHDSEPPDRLLHWLRYLEAVEDDAFDRFQSLRNS